MIYEWYIYEWFMFMNDYYEKYNLYRVAMLQGLTAEVRMHETIAAEMKFKNECLNRDLMKVNDEHKLLKEHVERMYEAL